MGRTLLRTWVRPWDIGHAFTMTRFSRMGSNCFKFLKNNSLTEFIMKVSNGTSKKLASTTMKINDVEMR
jgi:hypothetical protein